ncbi:MAG TPA: hypothetical protein VJT72_04370 [Pseudonocardiaceae bacterium]|nr:hypothetical protein [Pseudonocardiaceae bacterium]
MDQHYARPERRRCLGRHEDEVPPDIGREMGWEAIEAYTEVKSIRTGLSSFTSPNLTQQPT